MASKNSVPEPFEFDITKYLSDFKVPGIDVQTIIETQRKNIEALTQANKVAFEAFQAVGKRQAEILRQTIEELAKATKDIAEPGTVQGKAARQTELAKEAFERSLVNARELADMIGRANSEAADLLNKRFTQTLEDLRAELLKAGK